MLLEIDVSGSDIFEKDYTIVIASKKEGGPILGHRFSENAIRTIRERYNGGVYRYGRSNQGKANFRIRLYSTAIHYILKELKRRHKFKKVNLEICEDFTGVRVKQNLEQLLAKEIGLEVEMNFLTLGMDSPAHVHSHRMRKSPKGEVKKHLVPISIGEFETFLMGKKVY